MKRVFRLQAPSDRRRADDVDEELVFHLDMRAAELEAEGLAGDAARRAAEREFGDIEFTRRYCRDLDARREANVRRNEWLGGVWQDARYAARSLRRAPGFTAVAVLTLALGIGANTAIFSVVDALMLRPLPYEGAERLVWVEELWKSGDSNPAWGAHYLAWQAESRSLDGIAQIDGTTRTLTGAGEADRVRVGQVSASFLPMLGVRTMARGRNFTAAEDRPGGERVVILGYESWRARYGGDPAIVGKTIALEDAPFTVIGVMPSGFRFFERYDVWVPLALDPAGELAGPNHSFQTTVARLRPGVGHAEALAELDAIARRYEAARPDARSRIEGSRTRLVPLQAHLLGDTRHALLVLAGAVGLVLLIACANVANLLLARAAGRRRELAVRAALGAGRARLVQQLLTECLLLAAAGGAAGLLLAAWLVRLLGTLDAAGAIGDLARVTPIAIDGRVLAFTMLVSLATGLLFGLSPALKLARSGLHDALAAGGRASASQGRRVRGALMVSEIALAIVLLVGAGLLIRSFAALLAVDPGYRSRDLLTARLPIPKRYVTAAERVRFYDRVLERLAVLPGVAVLGATSHLPLTGYNWGATLRAEGRPVREGEQLPGAPIASVDPDYFRAMSIALRAGRSFTAADDADAPSVAVVSETLARRLFPGESALGKRFAIGGSDAPLTTVVGVVGDIRHHGLDRDADVAVYVSYRQTPRPSMALVLRATADPLALAPALRRFVHELDPSLPVYDVMTMDERLRRSVATRRFNLMLMGGFALLALLLAAVGVYGVIAYVATQRTHEVGIRMALGARHADVLRLFVGEGMTLVALGVALGALGAFAAARVMTSLLFGVTASDPWTFAGVTVLLSTIALLACWLPARRAARVSPLVALRHE